MKKIFKFIKIKGIPVKIIKIDEKWYYKFHICLCGCEKRIPCPTTKSGLNNHKYRGIPDFIHGHNNQFKNGHAPTASQFNNQFKNGHAPTSSQFKKGEYNPWFGNKEHMRELRVKQSNHKSSLETTVEEELNTLKIKYIPNVHQVEGIPDQILLNVGERPIVLFEDGCYHHGCRCRDWSKVDNDIFMKQVIEKRHYDKEITKKIGRAHV